MAKPTRDEIDIAILSALRANLEATRELVRQVHVSGGDATLATLIERLDSEIAAVARTAVAITDGAAGETEAG